MTFFTQVTKPSKCTQETMVKEYVGWSKGLKGLYAHTEEHRAHMRETMKGKNVGKTHSAETRAKLSAAHAAYYATHPGTMKGKKHKEETRALMSAQRTGLKQSAETLAKKSASMKGKNLGKTHSAETRAQMSAARKGKSKSKWSAESRAKFSASKATPVMTPHGLFPSVRAITEASGRDASTVRRWIRVHPEHYFYLV